MIESVTEEMHGSDWVPDLKNDYERAYGWKGNTIHESEMALFFECMLQCARIVLDTGRHCQRCDVTPPDLRRSLPTLRPLLTGLCMSTAKCSLPLFRVAIP